MVVHILLLLGGLMTSSSEEAADETKPSHFLSLTTASFDAHLQAHKTTLIAFHAPWCGHCKKLEPEFNKAAEELKQKNIPLAMIDAAEQKSIASRYNVKSFPTLIWFEGGQTTEYDGGRTADALVNWVSSRSGAAVIVTSSPPDAGEKPRVVLYANAVTDAFTAAAKQYRKKASFYFVREGKVPKLEVAHKGETPVVLENAESAAAIDQFIQANEMPLFGLLDGENFDLYMQAKKGLVWTLFDSNGMSPSEIDAQHRPMMSHVAQMHRGKYLFTYMQTDKFQDAIETMWGITSFPAIAVQKKGGDRDRYVHTGEMTAEAIGKFMDDVDGGRVAPYLKSQPVPDEAKNTGKVRIVVGGSFKKEVFQKDKDVLLCVYAPWCGLCKKMLPEYDKFAGKISEAKLNDVFVVAKFDGTVNESPSLDFDWNSFPAIYLVKAGQQRPIAYEGEQNFRGFVKFVKRHATKADLIKERIDVKQKKQTEL